MKCREKQRNADSVSQVLIEERTRTRTSCAHNARHDRTEPFSVPLCPSVDLSFACFAPLVTIEGKNEARARARIIYLPAPRGSSRSGMQISRCLSHVASLGGARAFFHLLVRPEGSRVYYLNNGFSLENARVSLFHRSFSFGE